MKREKGNGSKGRDKGKVNYVMANLKKQGMGGERTEKKGKTVTGRTRE